MFAFAVAILVARIYGIGWLRQLLARSFGIGGQQQQPPPPFAMNILRRSNNLLHLFGILV
jgi:hypothetical protein